MITTSSVDLNDRLGDLLKYLLEEHDTLREPNGDSNRSRWPVHSSPTLLTGLLKCGCCGAGMTLATGKGGRYRYYKCTTRIKKGVGCNSGNIPVEKLDTLVLKSLAERVFNPNRVKRMLKGLEKRIKASRGSQAEKLKKLARELGEVQKRTDRLYEAVEKGLLSLDPALTERAHKLGARRQAILAEIAGIEREGEMPLKMVAERHVDGFCRALKEKLFDKASSFWKEYLKLLVDRIEVQPRRVTIRGSYSALAMALKTTKLGEPAKVPSFGGGWLPFIDSYRTLCYAPTPEIKRIFLDIRGSELVA